MAVGHDEVVVADDRLAAVLGGAVDGGEFPYDVVVAYLKVALVAFLVFQVLGLLSDGRHGEEGVAFPDGGEAVYHDVALEDAAGADLDVLADDAVRSYFNVLGDLRARADDCGWMDHGGFIPCFLFLLCSSRRRRPTLPRRLSGRQRKRRLCICPWWSAWR